jgi:DNA-binding protein H-NS
MHTIQLDSLSIPELQTLLKEIPPVLESKLIQEKESARIHLESEAKKLGYSLADLVSQTTPKTKSKKTQSIAKYRNPNDPNQTYSGHGRKPNWLNELLNSGKSLEDFTI